MCSAAQELREEQLEDLIAPNNPGTLLPETNLHCTHLTGPYAVRWKMSFILLKFTSFMIIYLCNACNLPIYQLSNCIWFCYMTASSKKLKAAKQEPDCVEALEGLDTLANLAILGEGEGLTASSQATTKHPRHRPGCSCIVCIQPPSGKGPKHKQTCTCNVCLTVKRRFHTLMLRREKKQSEKDAETSRKKQQQQKLPVPEKSADDDPLSCSKTGNNSPNEKKVVSEGSDDDSSRIKSSTSPFKGQIDLNIQPEREEELSPGSDSGSMIRLLQDATEKYLRQQRLSSSGVNTSSVDNEGLQGGVTGEKISNGITLDGSHQDTDEDHHGSLSVKASASISATG